MVDTTAFRDAMAMLGGAVSIVTTAGQEGKVGMTASAVCSVTDSPATVLVCINRSAWAHRQFVQNGILCVNVLGAEHQALSGRFANRNIGMEERFSTHTWRELVTGSPVLGEALVSVDCRIVACHDVGSHTVFYGEVHAIKSGENRGALIYFNRDYHGVQSVRFS
ncbi:flavin reductase [Enterobacteriaceae bacterium 4M9]|nr:flavin reductase [Enterobacteriaceae bacterium 4M9]